MTVTCVQLPLEVLGNDGPQEEKDSTGWSHMVMRVGESGLFYVKTEIVVHSTECKAPDTIVMWF